MATMRIYLGNKRSGGAPPAATLPRLPLMGVGG